MNTETQVPAKELEELETLPATKDRSLHYDSISEIVKKSKLGEHLSGFPFNVVWPPNHLPNNFEVIITNGSRISATVELGSDGKEWHTAEGSGVLPRKDVAAWRCTTFHH
ncbi:MAG TPA: hypothetical protein VL576_00945 [Candidatus Paceibacterota bacterium]|jgi:hypothetical protein|nr:hypothetical protein [Candidatus Paceibacterota bacterium]